jgi:excisionase family DNA binding protein
MDTDLQKEWVTYREAQQYTSLGRTTLWILVSSGEIEAARVGKAVRIRRQSLDEFMQRHTNLSSSQ